MILDPPFDAEIVVHNHIVHNTTFVQSRKAFVQDSLAFVQTNTTFIQSNTMQYNSIQYKTPHADMTYTTNSDGHKMIPPDHVSKHAVSWGVLFGCLS